MEGTCSVLTLEQGYIQMPFENYHKLALEIENQAGILSVCQVYYRNGRTVQLKSIDKPKHLQVFSNEIEASRYHIHTPSHQFRVNFIQPSQKTIRNLLSAIATECKLLGYLYPTESFGLFYNSELLNISFSLSNIPHDSILELREASVYPPLQEIQIHVATLTGAVHDFYISDSLTVEGLKFMIQDADGVPCDQQRLIFAGKQLEDSRLLTSYNIQDDNTVNLVLRLRGGGVAQCFTFNGMNNQVNIQFSDKAPN